MTNQITWDKRIRRAEELLERNSSTSQVLAFYRHILNLQQQIGQTLASHTSPGHAANASLLEQLDVDLALQWLPALLKMVQSEGTAKLAEEARRISAAGEADQRQVLVEFLRDDQPAAYAPSSFSPACSFRRMQNLSPRG